MGWYRVIKTIKGHRYVYEQRTWREGKHVRTESRYVGPADGGGGRAPERGDRAEREAKASSTTARTLYHGSRVGIDGIPEASEKGTFGPGFYLSSKERAERYASYSAKTAANPEAYGSDGERFEGRVYAVEIGHLNLRALTWNDFLDLCEKIDPLGAATPSAKAKLQELLLEQGYDGLEIRDTRRPEVVIFPASVFKLKLRAPTDKEDVYGQKTATSAPFGGDTITLYHATTKESAKAIRKEGKIRDMMPEAEEDGGMVFLTDNFEAAKKYNEEVIPVTLPRSFIKSGKLKKVQGNVGGEYIYYGKELPLSFARSRNPAAGVNTTDQEPKASEQ